MSSYVVISRGARSAAGMVVPGMVVIGENTQASVASLFECRSLGSFTLKGKEKPVQIYAVVRRSKKVLELSGPGKAGSS